ncbi:MAG: SRPBCC family protein [Acidimicrobiales bacterium]
MSSANDQHPTARLARAEIEVPGRPEEVWQAIATGEGNAGWMFPAEIEAQVGGAIAIARGPYGGTAAATVTAWDPPHRFAFEEAMRAPDGSSAEPWATEYLVEAVGGGTCIVRVVSGFHRDGESWEAMVEGAGEGWRGALTILRAYLTHFAGQRATGLDATGNVGRPLDERAEVAADLLGALGLTGLKAGDPFRAPGDAPPLAGIVEEASPFGEAPETVGVLLRASRPCPGLFEISTFSMDGATVTVNVSAHLYGSNAAAVAEREQPAWQAWLADRFPGVVMSS